MSARPGTGELSLVPSRGLSAVFKMFLSLSIIFAVSILFTGELSASDVMELTLQEAYEMALESNHDIRSSEESVRQGELLKKQAVTVLFPKLTATAGYLDLNYSDGTGSDGSNWGINLNQTVYNGGRVWVAKRGAEYTLNAALHGLEFVRQSVLLDLIARSNELLSAEDLLKVSEKRVERVQEQLRQAQARVDLGDMPRTSVLAAQAALSSVQLERVKAQTAEVLAKARLSKLIGLDMSVRVQIPPYVRWPEDMDLSDLIKQAMSDRPDLAQGCELVRISEEQAELTSRNGYPDVDITGSYTQYSDDDTFAPESQIGINLTWPFFQGGLVKLQTEESLSRVRQAQEAYGSLVDAAELGIEEAWLTLKTLKVQEQLVADNLDTARENHRLANTRFNLGAAISLEVLDAEESLAEAENLEVNYKYFVRTARAALLYTIGSLDLSVFGAGK
ncbi:MAG: TolC family protein [bacterium]|nr:TolC family protein [bacterium]MDT8366489.1 TolC family protein [bacterium]